MFLLIVTQGLLLTFSFDKVLHTSNLLSLDRSVKIKNANGTTDEVSVFRVNATARQGMIKGYVEIGLIARIYYVRWCFMSNRRQLRRTTSSM